MHSGCSGRCRTLRTAAYLWREGMAMLDLNDPAKALVMQEQALELVRKIGGFDVLRARIHNNIGVIHACSDKPLEARREFERALFLLEGRIKPDSSLHRIIAKNHRYVSGLARTGHAPVGRAHIDQAHADATRNRSEPRAAV